MIFICLGGLCDRLTGQDYDDTGWRSVNEQIETQRAMLAANPYRPGELTKAVDDLIALGGEIRDAAVESNAWLSVREVAATSGEIPDTIPRVAANIVQIQVGNRGGSGTYLGAGYVLSCAHVCGSTGNSATVTFPTLGAKPGRVLASDGHFDMAVIELAELPSLGGIDLNSGDETPGQAVYPVGYSSGQMRGRAGVLRTYGGPVADGGANWSDSAVPSYPGDSGGPLLNAAGKLVGIVIRSDFQSSTIAVCNGRTQRFLLPWNAKLAAWKAAVAAGHNPWQYGSHWVQSCGPGGCSPPTQRPGNGTPIKPVDPPFVTPEVPVVPVVPTKPAPSTDDIVDAIYAKLELNADKFRGPAGPKGDAGPVGPIGPMGRDGKPGRDAEVDYDQLAAEVIRRLPPITVQNYDRQNNLVDQETYPFGTPLKFRYGVVRGE